MDRLYIASVKTSFGESLDMATVATDEETTRAYVAELYRPFDAPPEYEVVSFVAEDTIRDILKTACRVDDSWCTHGTGSTEFHIAIGHLREALLNGGFLNYLHPELQCAQEDWQ